MRVAIIFLLGAVIGGIVHAFFAEVFHVWLGSAFFRWTLRLRRLWLALFGRYEELIDEPQQLHVGGVRTAWYSLHGTGESPLRHLTTEFVEEWIELPQDLAAISEATRKELEDRARQGKSDVWNGRRYALIKYTPTRYGETEEEGVHFEFKLTDYAAHYGICLRMDVPGLVMDSTGKRCTIREKYFQELDPLTPNAYLTHAFGVNLLVMSRDNCSIFLQRGPHVTAFANAYHISVNEGMQYPTDLDNRGKPSFYKTATRGLREELGIDLEELGVTATHVIEFLNFGVVGHRNLYGILGWATLPLTAKQIQQSYYWRAKDRPLETRSTIYAVEFRPDKIVEFINNYRPWVHHGLATVYFAMVRKFGYQVVREQLERRPIAAAALMPMD